MKFLRGFDGLLFIPMVLLLVFGTVVLFSTSGQVAKDQIIFAFFGLTAYFIFTFIDFRVFKPFSVYFYLFNIVLLLITLGFGLYSKGAIRWIPIGIMGFTLQPSEFMKFGLIVLLSAFFSGSRIRRNLITFLVSVTIFLFPFGLIFLQPDLGTAIILVVIWVTISLFARFRYSYFALLILLFLTVSPLIFSSLKPYQQERIKTFFSPSFDSLGSGYHVIQSEIAVGSGQIFGRGFGRGTQSHLRFLPEYQTDFIFASLSEEWGFLGAAVVILLYGIIFFRIILISSASPYLFGQFLGIGVFSMIFSQTVINIGMNLGIAPITGIPLPLLSSGGSSLALTMVSLGLVQSVARVSKRV